MDTKEVLINMLTENTGIHMLDSGGTYGRHWQRNQQKDFEGEAATILEIRTYRDNEAHIMVTHNLYHWLADRVEYNEEMDKLFHKWATTGDMEDKHWLTCMEEFPAYLRTTIGDFEEEREVAGLYGDGKPFTVNTYNGEDLLSQTIQYLYMEVDQEAVILLQVHGGADVRGGYSAPRVFTVPEEAAIFDNAKATIYCTGNDRDHYWYSDDGWNWYYQGSCGYGAGAQLKTYPCYDLEETHEMTRERATKIWTRAGLLFDGEKHETHRVNWQEQWIEGAIALDSDGGAHCPHCGGLLEAGY